LGERYAREAIPPLLRPAALERIDWHKSRGDRIVIVSASLDVYLEPWCAAMELEVICTRLETHGERLTGRYMGGDCCGPEKARRVRERIRVSNYPTIYAYGDSDEDRELLGMADRRYYQGQELGNTPTVSSF
jgi:HAD superfamily hydrolase (TIGR01490 family)